MNTTSYTMCKQSHVIYKKKQIHRISQEVMTLLTKRPLLEYCKDLLKGGNNNIS